MAAPKGNKFALFNDGGRPRVYDSKEELIEQIQNYFDSFKSDGEEPPNPPLGFKPTVTGLALYLGFESRQSLYDYKKNQEFSYIIKKALTYVEMNYEQMLESKSATGAIFALKNMGWMDKYDYISSDGSLSPNKKTDLSKLTDKELLQYKELQGKVENA